MSALSFLTCSGCCGREKGPGCAAPGRGPYENGAGAEPGVGVVGPSPIQPIRELEEWEKYKQIQKHDEWGQPMFDECNNPIMEWELDQDGNYVALTVEERREIRKLYGMYMEDDEIPSQQQIQVIHASSINEPLLQQWNKQPSSQPSSPPLSAYEIFQSRPSSPLAPRSVAGPSAPTGGPLQHHPHIQHVRELEEWEKYKQKQKIDQWGQPMYDEGGAPIMEWELDRDGNYIELAVEERRQVRKLYGMYTEEDQISSQP